MHPPLPWMSELIADLTAEYGDRPRVAAFATADDQGQSYVRFVVCRRIDPDGSLWIVSDARSEKNGHLRWYDSAELAFWLASRRVQFRLRGAVEILSADGPDEQRNARRAAARRATWRELSDASRALFLWPAPGKRRTRPDADFPQGVRADQEPPSVFEVLALRPDVVERLSLTSHPHRRTRWQASDSWRAEELNP